MHFREETTTTTKKRSYKGAKPQTVLIRIIKIILVISVTNKKKIKKK